MNMSLGASFGLFLTLPVLVAQWVGVVGLAKGGRNLSWWCMVIGAAMTTVGSVASTALIMWLLFGSQDMGRLTSLLPIVGGLSGLGSLLFMVGFAIHGLQSNRMKERVEELEAVLVAQGERLNVRNGDRVS